MKFDELPDWVFDVQETSANVYRVTGRDILGRSVERHGIDPEALLQEAREYAIQLEKDD
jgi:hypothetical protein